MTDTATFDHTPLTCPLCPPSERSDLYLTFTAAYGLAVGDPSRPDAPTMADADTETWKVECIAGHVILLPGLPGCGCDDDASDCWHNQDDFDSSEESSQFRTHDLDRLRETLRALGGGE